MRVNQKGQKPFRAQITREMKQDLEDLAKKDGSQRGYFITTSGALYCDRVSATSSCTWLFKTKAGKPYYW